MPISTKPPGAREGISSAIAIERLSLSGFRNHAASRLEVGAAPLVVLSGPNGAGKTNVLEALSLLSPGRGLRRAAFSDMADIADEAGERRWAVSCRVHGLAGEVDIGMAWRAGANAEEGGARQLKIGGKRAASAKALGAHVRLAWLTPAMDGLFTGPAAERRRFIDRLTLAVDPAHAARINALQRLLRQRNRLLEQWRAQARWLDAVEAQLAEVSVAVAAARLVTVEAIVAGMALLDETRAPFPRAGLALRGWLEERLAHLPAVDVEDAYRQWLADARAEDAAAARTLIGAHRSDLDVRHEERDMAAKLCSTGEQKALLIAIMLAHAAAVKERLHGHAPLLLLDEVAAHLDARRRRGLFEALKRLGAQAWLSGTEAAVFDDLRGVARFFVVDNGQVRIA